MKQSIKRGLTALLCAVLLLSALPFAVSGDSVTGFPDVPEGAWYVQYLGKIIQAQAMVGVSNIIGGYPDGTFRPDQQVKRGEFLKMIFEAARSSGNEVSIAVNEAHRKAHWAGQYYTMAEDDNVLVADPYASGDGVQVMFPCTWDALEQPMTRYEMAVVLNNVCRNIAMQKTVNVAEPEQHISDYAEIPSEYVTAVEQMYGKGLLTGNENAFFLGNDTLTRAQAATVLYRFLFFDTINGQGLQDWASYSVVKTTGGEGGQGGEGGSGDGQPTVVSEYWLADPSESFANRLQAGGHIDAWGNLDDWAKTELFGTPYKSYFVSSYDAAGHMETVDVPIWTVDKSGQKISSTVGIVVNKAVAAEVHDIFQTIYDDPEQFPIYGGWSAGGARYTDTMRHSWGCAIDVNALYNCECNTYSGALRVTCGYGWWPLNSVWTIYAGSLSAPSIYSIGKNEGEYGYSVVKAFAKYGWGWGGNGYSKGQKFDYMHFSVLPSGG